MSQMPTSSQTSVAVSTSRLGSATHTPLVLVADAEPESSQEREQHLRAAGTRVLLARTAFEAIVKASCQLPDLIVLDESIGKAEALETARLLRICPVTARTPVVCLRRGRRVPVRVLAALRRRSLA